MQSESEIPTVSTVLGQGTDARRVIRVSDWTLTQWEGRGDERPRVRDIDLARRAGLAVPRDVRRTIQSLIDEGIIVASAHDDQGGHATATALIVESFVTIGKGGQRAVLEYWLDEEAALHVLMALRTPMAIEIRRQVVHVFVQVRHGLLPTQAVIPPELVALLTQIVDTQRSQGEAIAALAGRMTASESGSGIIQRAQRRAISHSVASIARGRVHAGLSPSLNSARRWAYTRLEAAASWSGAGRSWDRLPASKFGLVLVELEVMQREVKAALEAIANRQLTLAGTDEDEPKKH